MSYFKTNFQEFCDRSGCDTAEVTRINKAIGEGAWLAGGAIRRTLIGHALDSDFDFFFKSQEAMTEWESRLPSTLNLVRETEHHKHWKGTLPGSDLPVDIQAIRFRFYETAEQVIDSFDYTVTMFALDGETLVTTPYALWDLGRKKLAVHKISYPIATMRRLLKYTKQGFTACAGCLQSILKETASSPDAMAQLDIEYID